MPNDGEAVGPNAKSLDSPFPSASEPYEYRSQLSFRSACDRSQMHGFGEDDSKFRVPEDNPCSADRGPFAGFVTLTGTH